MNLRHSSSLVVAAAVSAALAVPAAARAQQVVTPAFDFSGVLFGAYGFRNDSAGKATLGGSSPNQFTLDRAYLTFRMPAGDNAQIRITTDVFQNTSAATNGYYQGWAVRVKYGYLQYTGLKNAFGAGSNLTGRIGVLHTVAIDHEEGFWPRYLNQTAIERNGFFSSADAGAAGLLTLGNKWGEIYGTITNGPGYASYEKDRFKDFALRVSLTPFADHGQASAAAPPGAATPSAAPAASAAILRTFTISPWFYKGWTGSNFQAGGAGQVGSGDNGAVTDGLQRDRWGVFAGVKERRLTAGVEYAQRMDQSETGANTTASPRVVHDSTGRLIDGFIVARPAEWFDGSQKSNWSVVARYDRFTPNTDATAPAYAGSTPAYNFMVLGLSYDLTSRVTFTADWQQQSPTSLPSATGTNVRPTPKTSSLFLHWQATF